MAVYQVKEWLARATRLLEASDVPTARLDALILLEDMLTKDRSWLLAHPEFELEYTLISRLDSQIKRRAKHEPLAYIRGKSEFYGREFIVSPATLQPRPETETLIDQLIKLKLPTKPIIADIGTGSGAIAITAKLEIPNAIVLATDIQAEALKIAKQNAEKFKAGVAFYQGNLLEPILGKKVDVILANLPYVPNRFTINQAAMQEPAIAIFGGEDGLDYYRELFKQVAEFHTKPYWIITEILPFQHHELTKFAHNSNYDLLETEDFIQAYRLKGV